jgi:hypothetical protein
MDMEKITGKEWLKYGVLYPLGIILLGAVLDTIGRVLMM